MCKWRRARACLVSLVLAGSGSATAHGRASVSGQLPPPRPPDLLTPEVHDDRTVTFRLLAPAAHHVVLWGDWMPHDATMELAMRLNPALDRRAAFNHDIDKNNLVPLWEQLHTLVPREPARHVTAALWRYRELREQS